MQLIYQWPMDLDYVNVDKWINKSYSGIENILGFPQLILGHKQTFTVKNSWYCTYKW